MIYIWLNAIPILAATVLGLILAWGEQALPARPRRSPGGWIATALALFWLNAILAGALILAPPKAGAWTMALGSAVVIWAGFVAPVLAASGARQQRTLVGVTGEALWWLAAFVLAAALMHGWGLVPPPVTPA